VGLWLRDAGRGLQSGLRQFGSFDSRLSPLAHDDSLRRGEFAPRGFEAGSRVTADIAGIGKTET